jgi:hypothetical protein
MLGEEKLDVLKLAQMSGFEAHQNKVFFRDSAGHAHELCRIRDLFVGNDGRPVTAGSHAAELIAAALNDLRESYSLHI